MAVIADIRRVSAVGATQKTAERNLKEAIAARASRTTYTEVTPDSSFMRLVELWLDDLDLDLDLDLEGKVSESTRALYERNRRQRVMPAWENYTLREITTDGSTASSRHRRRRRATARRSRLRRCSASRSVWQ